MMGSFLYYFVKFEVYYSVSAVILTQLFGKTNANEVKRPILPSAQEVKNAFERHNIISDGLIPKAPDKFLLIKFWNNRSVELGNVLLFDECWELPGFIYWDADPGCFHTLIFLNIDHPNDKFPQKRQYLHWLVGNIPEALVKNGRILSSYLMPMPPPIQYGTHRLVFLAYKQPSGLIEFTEPFMPALPLPETRGNWTIENFVSKYHLIGPVAGNFYRIDWQNEINHLKYEVCDRKVDS